MTPHDDVPARFDTSDALEDFLSRPDASLTADMAAVEGDILILGVGGKMGPTLARLARNAAPGKRVLAVARFTDSGLQRRLADHGIETIACDLLDRAAVARLPQVANVIFMAGHKFGASGAPALTWALNAHVPAIVAERFCDARIVAFSSGNIYPLVLLSQGGAGKRPSRPLSGNMRNPVWRGNGCSSIFPGNTARPAGCSA